MGNWRNRPPRRRYFYDNNNTHQDRPPYRSSDYYDLDPPPHSPSHRGFADDGVPLWEKKFCYLIGSVPWRKVVDSRNYIRFNSNILNWDDSAGKEAFQNAKDRFWAEINGRPCDISLPDPNMYIDDINWSPDIDPEVVKDLERAFFALPDEGVKDVKVGRKGKKTRNFVSFPPEGYHGNPGDIRNPWECNEIKQSGLDLRDKEQGWHAWDTAFPNSSNVNKDDNPWERSFPGENEGAKRNTGGDNGDKSWALNHSENYVKQSTSWGNGANPWESSRQAVEKDKGWGNFRDNFWGDSRQEPRKLNNSCNSWEYSKFQATGTQENRGWTNTGNNVWGWKQRDTAINEPKTVGFRKSGGDWGTWNDVSRKRGGAYQYNSLQKHKVSRG